MARNNMLVKTAVTGSPQRRNAERPGGRSAGGRAALGALCGLTRTCGRNQAAEICKPRMIAWRHEFRIVGSAIRIAQSAMGCGHCPR
jgi:hypothetical protein